MLKRFIRFLFADTNEEAIKKSELADRLLEEAYHAALEGNDEKHDCLMQLWQIYI